MKYVFMEKRDYIEIVLNDSIIKGDLLKETIEELKTRVTYLAWKWNELLILHKRTLFILKINFRTEEEYIFYLKKVYNKLNQKVTGEFVLLEVMESKYSLEKLDFIKNGNFLVRGKKLLQLIIQK